MKLATPNYFRIPLATIDFVIAVKLAVLDLHDRKTARSGAEYSLLSLRLSVSQGVSLGDILLLVQSPALFRFTPKLSMGEYNRMCVSLETRMNKIVSEDY